MYVVDELTKSVLRAVERSYPNDVESVFSERASLVEAAYVDLPTYVDSSGSNAKNSQFPKTANREASTNCQDGL